MWTTLLSMHDYLLKIEKGEQKMPGNNDMNISEDCRECAHCCYLYLDKRLSKEPLNDDPLAKQLYDHLEQRLADYYKNR